MVGVWIAPVIAHVIITLSVAAIESDLPTVFKCRYRAPRDVYARQAPSDAGLAISDARQVDFPGAWCGARLRLGQALGRPNRRAAAFPRTGSHRCLGISRHSRVRPRGR